jgi:hypothetical protein
MGGYCNTYVETALVENADNGTEWQLVCIPKLRTRERCGGGQCGDTGCQTMPVVDPAMMNNKRAVMNLFHLRLNTGFLSFNI